MGEEITKTRSEISDLLSEYFTDFLRETGILNNSKSRISFVKTGDKYCLSVTQKISEEDFLKIINKSSHKKGVFYPSIKIKDPENVDSDYSFIEETLIIKANTVGEILVYLDQNKIWTHFGLGLALKSQPPDRSLKSLKDSLENGEKIKKFTKSVKKEFFQLLEKCVIY